MNPLWTLAPLSALAGALLMWGFRRTADIEGLRRAAKRMQAHLLEFWLFVDEPSSVWKSWRGLLGANARFLRALLPPLILFSIPMTPVFFLLDAFYGSAPLTVGQPTLVTLAMDQLDSLPALTAPPGILVESPPVRIFSDGQVSWRIRPQRALSSRLEFALAGQRVAKSVTAGRGFHSSRRTRSWIELLRYPTEAPLPRGPIAWIEVEYPPEALSLLGLQAHWSVWFLLFSVVGALLV